MPTRFENRMYTASPAGNWNVKNPNITGIIQSMIWLVWDWRGSVLRAVVIFCCTHMVAPTSIGSRNGYGCGAAWTRCTRFMPRKSLLSGMLPSDGFHE